MLFATESKQQGYTNIISDLHLTLEPNFISALFMTVAIDISHGKVLDQKFSAAFELSNNSSLVGGCLFCIQELKSDQLPIIKNKILNTTFYATVNLRSITIKMLRHSGQVIIFSYQLCVISMLIVKPCNHVDIEIVRITCTPLVISEKFKGLCLEIP